MEETALLEQRLEEAFSLLDISHVSRASLGIYCNLLKLKDEATYCHCIRVALYGIKVAELLHLDVKAMFYSGLMHDVGKVMIDKEILAEKRDFNEADYKKIKKHPLYGYYLLRDIHNFSAEIILRHHRHTKGYPKRLPASKVSYSPDTKALIEYYSKILAIIDFYDSASTRKNEELGRVAAKEEARSLLIQRFPAEAEKINLCYEEGVFG